MKSYNEMAESVLNRRDKYIVERRKQMKKLTTAISCVCLCVLVGVGARQGGRDVMPSGTVITESSPGIEHEKGMLAVENFSSEEPPAVVGKSSIITDAPVQDETGNTGTLTHYDEVWGGSYMDTEGWYGSPWTPPKPVPKYSSGTLLFPKAVQSSKKPTTLFLILPS